MEEISLEGKDGSEQVRTGADAFGPWLTVQEAVAYCLSKGLSRTSKTVRKWAQRARDPESGTAEISVKAQDTENGFRWLIDRFSLDVKIEQEKEFEVRRDGEAKYANASEHLTTGAHLFGHVHSSEVQTAEIDTAPNSDGPVQTGANPNNEQMVEFLMKQIDMKDQQLAVKDRQIESMLERDHETNILIQGLQTSLSGVVRALPVSRQNEREKFQSHDLRRGDISEVPHSEDTVQ